MSWAKKVRKASDVVKPGETVEAVILGVNAEERRISLGLKQALGIRGARLSGIFRWARSCRAHQEHHEVRRFRRVAEGVEGMIHVSEISAEKRINHPQDVLRLGQW